MEDLAVTAMARICAELPPDQDAAEMAQALIGSAQDVQYDATTGRLTIVFVRRP
ncbi:hypothetical protein AB0L70_10085 [Kribbella sp. NPDC051952]|uniref:hypothetical protein n=1 Tax=Kribbella sp. NPDC051952 TaxID=3154851 RepID=UPI00342CC59F